MEEENRLILKIQKHGSRSAADTLVRKYYQEIYVYVYRQIGDREDSMDLTQEIFISALQTIRYYDRKKSSFRTWLYRIATHKVIDHRRKSRVVTVSFDDPEWEQEIPDPEDPFGRILDSELLRRIEEYVSGVEDQTQMIFRLHIYDEQPFKKIAEDLDLPENTVKTKYYRLQKLIRKEFGNDE